MQENPAGLRFGVKPFRLFSFCLFLEVGAQNLKKYDLNKCDDSVILHHLFHKCNQCNFTVQLLGLQTLSMSIINRGPRKVLIITTSGSKTSAIMLIVSLTKNPVTQASSMNRYGSLVDCANRRSAYEYDLFYWFDNVESDGDKISVMIMAKYLQWQE